MPDRAAPQLQVHPFAPVYDEHARILILGSFPSVRSRAEGFYYGHPRNRFWQLMAMCLAEDEPKTMQDKRRLLLTHHIALWDVLSSCRISGSSDSSITSAVPNDLRSLLRSAPVQRILFNGKAAGQLCLRYHGDLHCQVVTLPSTSPANAAWSLERLCQAWRPWLFMAA